MMSIGSLSISLTAYPNPLVLLEKENGHPEYTRVIYLNVTEYAPSGRTQTMPAEAFV